MRTIERSTKFKRDYKRETRGRHRATLDADLLPVLVALASDAPLDPRYVDHLIAKCSDRRPPSNRRLAVGTQEQVSRGSAAKQRRPPLPAMFGSIVREVATLAERGEITLMVVAGIMVEMRAGEHHPRARRHHLARKLHHAELFGKAIG